MLDTELAPYLSTERLKLYNPIHLTEQQVIQSINGFYIGTLRWSYVVAGYIPHTRESENFSTYEAANAHMLQQKPYLCKLG